MVVDQAVLVVQALAWAQAPGWILIRVQALGLILALARDLTFTWASRLLLKATSLCIYSTSCASIASILMTISSMLHWMRLISRIISFQNLDVH